MGYKKLINYKNFEKILMVIIIILFSVSAFEFTQKRATPQETDDRYAYELKATNFTECFIKKNCVGLNSFSEFLSEEEIINYRYIKKKNRDLQRILYSYHPFYSFLEIVFKKIFNQYSKLILILSINLFVLLSIYSLNNNFFSKKTFYFSSIILFFNPIFPGLISGYPFILSTCFAIFSLVSFEKRNYFIHYLMLILACLSHIFGLLFLFFFIILNFTKNFLEQKSPIKILTNIKLHINNLILLSLFLLIYFTPINFTNVALIKGSDFIELNYLLSLNKFLDMIILKISILSEFFNSFYLLGKILLIIALFIVGFLITLFFTTFKNLNLNLKSILISLLIFFVILLIFPNILIIERFLPFYSIFLISILIYTILNLKQLKKVGLYLLTSYCVISILAGSNNIINKKNEYKNYSDLFMDEHNIKKYANTSNNLFLFNSNEALFYKFLILGLQKNNYFLNIRNAEVNIENIEKNFENIYLVSDSNLVSKNKNTLNSNLNKKLNILSKKKVINKIILFSFDDTIININNINFQIKAKNPSEIGSLNTNELEIISKKKIYILKILDSENNSILDLDTFINGNQIQKKRELIENKIDNFKKKNNCETKLYDVMYASIIYKVSCLK
tara:strand:+ start:204 stop:2063 length:1860 start_codon:yes stop_codon:yes gene_type:complete